MSATTTEVLVIGGGFAGLSAAREVQRSGCEVLVLEARDRVGGRTETTRLSDGTQAAPWEHPDAAQLDGITLAGWLNTQEVGDEHEKAIVGRMLAGGLQTLEAREASLLSMLFYIRSGFGVDSLLGMAGGAQQDRIVGGPAAIAEALADSLGEGAVRTGDVVGTVRWDDDGVEVVSTSGSWRARRVILALPAILLDRIAFDPVLPLPTRVATRRLLPGVGLKVHLIFDRPFWREAGLSGQANASAGPITETVDNSVPGGDSAVLTAFAYGADAVALRRLDPEQRQQAITDELASLFGEQVHGVREYIEHDWSAEEFTGGCFSAGFGTGGFSTYGPDLGQPVGPIHFAGTEYAQVWNGYFEGALHSGRQTATAVIETLS